MISSSTALIPWRASISTKARRRVGAPGQIGLQQPLPFLDHLHRRIGKAIAGQVDQIVAVGQREEVDLLRAAGRVRRPRQRLAAGQRVDQRWTCRRSSARQSRPRPGRRAAGRPCATTPFRNSVACAKSVPPGLVRFGVWRSRRWGMAGCIRPAPPRRRSRRPPPSMTSARTLKSGVPPVVCSAPSVSASRLPVSGLAVVARQRSVRSRTRSTASPMRSSRSDPVEFLPGAQPVDPDVAAPAVDRQTPAQMLLDGAVRGQVAQRDRGKIAVGHAAPRHPHDAGPRRRGWRASAA